MAKEPTTPAEKKPARSKSRVAATTPRSVRKTTKVATEAETIAVNDKPVSDANELSKKELIERLVRDTGMKKGEARRAMDAVLTVLRGALEEGANMNAAPLGKIKIARTKETENGQLTICRIKLKKPVPLATAAE
jgi:hypothetical protein